MVPPTSRTRDSLAEYFLKIVPLVASRSTCPRRAVGAIITDVKGHVLSMGYNGVPSGIPHCNQGAPCPGFEDEPGDTRRCLAVHAEQNVIMQCQNLSQAFTMYVSCSPCFVCAKMICNTPIREIYVSEAYTDTEGLKLLIRRGISLNLPKYDLTNSE